MPTSHQIRTHLFKYLFISIVLRASAAPAAPAALHHYSTKSSLSPPYRYECEYSHILVQYCRLCREYVVGMLQAMFTGMLIFVFFPIGAWFYLHFNNKSFIIRGWQVISIGWKVVGRPDGWWTNSRMGGRWMEERYEVRRTDSKVVGRTNGGEESKNMRKNGWRVEGVSVWERTDDLSRQRRWDVH